MHTSFVCVYVCAHTCVHVPAQARGHCCLCFPPALHVIYWHRVSLCTRNSKAQKDCGALQAPPISASPALEFTGAWCHAHFLCVCRELQVFSWLHSERFANGAISSASISCFETRSFYVAYGDIEMSSHVVFKLKRVVFTSYFVFLNRDN